MRKPFSLQKRPTTKTGRYVYYCQFWNENEDRYGTAVSTRQTSKAAAEAWAYEELKHPRRSKKSVTFAQFAEAFWDFETSLYVQSKQVREKPISRSYCGTMEINTRCHILPAFGNRTLSSITPADIEHWILELRKKLAPATINHALSALKIMMKEAVRRGLIVADPSAVVEELRDNCRVKGIPEPDEFRRLFLHEDALHTVWQDNVIAYTANLLAATTGMRQGEVLGLKREDVHEDYVEVKRTWDASYGSRQPKCASFRTIPLPRKILTTVLTVAYMNGAEPSDFIFRMPGTEKPLGKQAILAALYKAMDAIGIDEQARKERNITFHSWRHFANTWLRSQNVPDNKVRMVTGHQTEDMTEHYSHLKHTDLPEVRDAQMKLLEGMGEREAS